MDLTGAREKEVLGSNSNRTTDPKNIFIYICRHRIALNEIVIQSDISMSDYAASRRFVLVLLPRSIYLCLFVALTKPAYVHVFAFLLLF